MRNETKKELQIAAKTAGIKGYTAMTKAMLREALGRPALQGDWSRLGKAIARGGVMPPHRAGTSASKIWRVLDDYTALHGVPDLVTATDILTRCGFNWHSSRSEFYRWKRWTELESASDDDLED